MAVAAMPQAQDEPSAIRCSSQEVVSGRTGSAGGSVAVLLVQETTKALNFQDSMVAKSNCPPRSNPGAGNGSGQ